MDEGEGGLSFDFEGGLDAVPTHPTASNPIVQQPESSVNITPGAAATSTNVNNSSAIPPAAPTDGGMGNNQRRSFRQTVCRHWLRSLCMKGDACGFLHQYDKSRMPVCRFFRLYGECREQDCVYKHTNEDIKECNMYDWFNSFPFSLRFHVFIFFIFNFLGAMVFSVLCYLFLFLK